MTRTCWIVRKPQPSSASLRERGTATGTTPGSPRLICSELDRGRYVETATALPGTVTSLTKPYAFEIDPAGLAQPGG
ncbi:hypothetical protein OG301_00195 [Streptomyces platensis]|uniref:hypothetical protein n=1 Tax=Streptomyces platensis TaxID=58346 RepID=UPI002ED0A9E3|nr:hypothetical protein OG301_00195 [Streptomyces platensis]